MNDLSVFKLFKRPLAKQIMYYALFSFGLWFFHLMLISLISFFHFLLNHNIRTVGDWISDRGWQIIIISKLTIFYLATLFINVRLSKNLSWSSLTRDHIQKVRSKFNVIILFLIFALIFSGGTSINDSFIFSIFRSALVFLGITIFFIVDYMIIYILDHLYPLEEKQTKILKVIVFPVLFYMFSSMTFKYEQNLNANIFCFFLLMMYLGEWRRKNWTYPIYSLFIFIIPSYVLLGADPVWGVIYSPFITSKVLSFNYLFALIFSAIMYLEYDRQKNPEYIYRD